jgi:hypothetical protein
MPAEICLPQVQACAIRVTQLDAAGSPLGGASALYTSDALTTLTASPQYEDADEITEKNACGTVCVDYKGDDSFKRLDIDLTICTVDPYLHQLLSQSGDTLTDGEAIGFAYPPLGALVGDGISIELWSKRILNGALDPDFPYAWWALPLVKNLRLGDREFANSAQASPFTGQANENPNWLDGPLNDWPVASDRVLQFIPTTELPDIQCGYQVSVAS